MNKKGFTLVELIAVIAIIGIIALIATPNVVRLIDEGRKDKFIADAQEMISKAKYMIKLDKYKDNFTDESGCKVASYMDLGLNFKDDPDGNIYKYQGTKVKMCIEDNRNVYYVKTMSSGNNARGISDPSNNGWVKEECLKADNEESCNGSSKYDFIISIN